MNYTDNFEYPYNSTSTQEVVWISIRVIIIVSLFIMVAVVCYLRSKFKLIEEGNLGSMDSKVYMEMDNKRRDIIEIGERNAQVEEDGNIREISLVEMAKIKKEEREIYFV